MPGYLIVYNRRSREWSVTEFPGGQGHRAAMLERLDRERTNEDPDVEIAALSSDSLDTVKKTHSRYFEGQQLVAH